MLILKAKSKMGYTNHLTVYMMKELDLFDDIEYKYIKDIINEDVGDIEVEIEDLDCDRIAYCKTRFKFEIDLGAGSGILKVDLAKEYNTSSPYAIMMLELEEEEEEEDEDFPINIPVVGLGWCRYKTMEDVKRELTYCKNTLYKIKGDKTAYDMEGKYCETEDEEEEDEE